MSYGIIGFKILLFIISNIGYWELMGSKTKFKACYFPSMTIAVQVTLLLAAGLLNILELASWTIFTVGILLFGRFTIRAKGLSFLRKYLKLEYIYIVVCMSLLAGYVKDKLFVSYDNFTHWALVVKHMLAVDRFPNFQDSIITFQEYPLGSSVYIYFVAKMIDASSEPVQMLAQNCMIVCCLAPLLQYAGKNKTASFVYMMVLTSFLFVYNITSISLLVDTLLPVVSMCGLLFIYQYAGHFQGGHEAALASCYFVLIAQIKNSGLFFCIFATAWLAAKIRKGNMIRQLLCAAAPYLSVLLWHRHCRYVFAASENSDHAMTAANYKSIIGGKTPETIRMIGADLFQFAATYKDTILVFAGFTIAGIMVAFLARTEWKTCLKISAIAILLYITYQFGMYGMYVFSMKGTDATSLSSVTRYTRTILIAIMYLLVIIHLKILNLGNIKALTAAAVSLLCCIEVFGFMKGTMNKHLVYNYTNVYDRAPDRLWFENMKKTYQLPQGASYCFLLTKWDTNFYKWIGRYVFDSVDTEVRVIEDPAQMSDINADYILIEDMENPFIIQWIQDNYPDQLGREVIRR